jgi:OOP family OmpA-OmpF porin
MRMVKAVIAFIFILIVSASHPSVVLAASKSGPNPIPETLGGFSLSPTVGGYFFSGSEDREATLVYGLKFGYDYLAKSMTERIGVEATLNYFSARSKKGSGDDSGYLLRLDAIYPFVLEKKWMPFLAVGGGGIFVDSASHSDSNPLFNYGLGLKYFLEDYVAVRADARHLIVYDNVDTRNNYEVSLGVSYYFGKVRKVTPPLQPASAQDGNETAANGKKASETVTKSVTAVPSLEDIDNPPARKSVENKPAVLPEPAPVPPAPSPPVSAPAITTPVVPEKPIVPLELTIEFDFDKSDVKPRYFGQLREIADFMKANPKASARIEGHADNIGRDSYNVKLSWLRATSVKNNLVKFGASRDRISTTGFGSTKPVADNTTDEGRQRNRRSVTIVTVTID